MATKRQSSALKVSSKSKAKRRSVKKRKRNLKRKSNQTQITSPTEASSWYKINDPIHKAMCFSQDEKNLIRPFLDNELFQRLRGIKQMGLANLIFPGAVHSRFSHSLGACYLACHILGNLKGNSKNLTSTDDKAFILAALLHDIGHGPFSHAFERIFKDDDKQKILEHEDWTLKFIEFLFTKDRQLKIDYKKSNKISSDKKVADELREIYQKIKKIFHCRSSDRNYYSDLISSQLDVDRMDYLVRDSHFCGVEYGTYDVDWLIDSITTAKDDRGISRLCLTPKGIGVAENLLMARLFMRKHVCLNKKVQAAEYLLMKFVEIIYCEDKTRKFLLEEIKHNHFLKFINILKKYLNIRESKDRRKKKILANGFEDYKYMIDAEIFVLLRQISDLKSSRKVIKSLKEISERLLKRQLPAAYLLRNEKNFISKKIVDEFKKKYSNLFNPWQIEYHTPIVPTCYALSTDPILISAKTENFPHGKKKYYILDEKELIVSNLASQSVLINKISGMEDELFFLFIDKSICNRKEIAELIEEMRHYGCATYFR